MDIIDGHQQGTAESTYFQRARARYVQPPRVERPVTIWIATAAALVLAGAAVVSFGWMWFQPDPTAAAGEMVGYMGTNPLHIALVALGVIAILTPTWVAVALGIARGVRWVRYVGLGLALITCYSTWSSINGPYHPGQRSADIVALVDAGVLTVLLALPNRAWWDWRNH